MTQLRLRQITISKEIQPRAGLSQDTINEYCDAHIEGDIFPNIVVFDDGNRHWLADGWHRIKAAEKAKITSIECDIIRGTKRDAIKYSLSANSRHGLNRTHSDKRQAVMVCIGDDEWSQMSARQIAKTCGVSHSFVNLIYKEIAEQKETKEISEGAIGGNVSTSENNDVLKKSVTAGDPENSEKKINLFAESVEPIKDDVYVVPEGMLLVEKFSYEEIMENYKETLDENDTLSKILESDEPMRAAAAELKKITANLRIVESRVNGLMSEKNAAIRLVKARDAVIKKLNAQLKELGATVF